MDTSTQGVVTDNDIRSAAAVGLYHKSMYTDTTERRRGEIEARDIGAKRRKRPRRQNLDPESTGQDREVEGRGGGQADGEVGLELGVPADGGGLGTPPLPLIESTARTNSTTTAESGSTTSQVLTAVEGHVVRSILVEIPRRYSGARGGRLKLKSQPVSQPSLFAWLGNIGILGNGSRKGNGEGKKTRTRLQKRRRANGSKVG
ncbi:MAG: hypothetical protein M1834_001859 [Cirrosporium novae-zelandiae]|nr:MAG: hypothetical protein M1834_001859 [Cirrosporium novae-zelandiae]